MYEILKHAVKQTTTLFTSPCESMARARFNKSASLLSLNETLELLHEGKVIDSVSKKVQRDEDGQIIFPEASSKLEHTMKSLYCIAGSLPAQFRSSPVDCGIGWKEHAKKELRKDEEPKKDLNAVSSTRHRLDVKLTDSFLGEAIKQLNQVLGLTKADTRKVTEYDDSILPPIDLSTVKVGDQVMLVDGKTFVSCVSRDLTRNKIYEVCKVDLGDPNGLHIRLIDDVGDPVWVYTADLRAVSFDKAQDNL